MTLKEFATKYQMSFTAHNKRTNYLKNWDGWGEGAVRYDLRVVGDFLDVSVLKTEFSMGSDRPLPPIEEILSCLQLDTRGGEHNSFEEFADEFGYDADSIKALRIYEACVEMKEKLLKFFGTEEIYNEFMECEEECKKGEEEYEPDEEEKDDSDGAIVCTCGHVMGSHTRPNPNCADDDSGCMECGCCCWEAE